MDIDSSHSFNNVLNQVVQHDLCIGCGICAASCPSKILEMRWSLKGELTPNIGDDCLTNCNLCLSVCPFYDIHTNQTEIADSGFATLPNIKNIPDLGYYLAAYVGFATEDNLREKAASGGLVTWLLEELFEKGIIDGAVTVIEDKNREKDRLFKYEILKDKKSIRSAASSKYYPVEMSDVLRKILSEKDDQKYAVVVLPCRSYGLRKAMAKIPKLKRRIHYIIGLTCGQLVNSYFTEYCSTISGINHHDLATVSYRSKRNSLQASHYSFLPTSCLGIQGKQIPNIPIQGHLWANYYFTHHACLFCDDVFSETADINCMDAWLPEYEINPKGNSLLVVRNLELNQFLLRGIEKKSCNLDEISIDRVLESQSGVIIKKRKLIAARLYYARINGLNIPHHRIEESRKLYKKNKFAVDLQFAVLNQSKSAWKMCRDNGDVERFHQIMAPLEKKIQFLIKIRRLNLFFIRIKKLIIDPIGMIKKIIAHFTRVNSLVE